MLFTFLLLGFVNSSCITRNFEECLSLNVEYQESCQLSQGECRPRPEKCTEIDATYPLNCRTNECYYSKRFNKCLSQPFTRLLNEVAGRGDHHDHQVDSQEGQHQQEPQHTEEGPQPTEGGPLPPPYQPPSPPVQPTGTHPTQNDTQIEQPQGENTNDVDEGDEGDEGEEEDSQENTSLDDEPWNEPEVNSQFNSTNSSNNSNSSNNNSQDGFNDTYYGFQNLIEEEIKIKLSQSDEKKQIEIKSSGTSQLIIAFITMIIWI